MAVPAYDSLPMDQNRMDGWFLSISYCVVARSTTTFSHTLLLPGTLYEGSTIPIFCQVPWDSKLVSAIT